jgi:predicted HicB family RNase H-like nuclease
MEVDMEALSKKTTILFSPELHRRLAHLAAQRGVSMGDLVREACEAQYGIAGSEARLEAAGALGAFRLPVATTRSMKEESVPLAGSSLR